MQPSGNLIGRGIKFSSGMQLGQHYLGGGDFLAVYDHVIYRDAAAIVHHSNGVVNVDGDLDAGGVTRQSFVHGIVHNLIDQVVQAHLTVGADVHGWP